MRAATHSSQATDDESSADFALSEQLPSRYRVDGVLGRGGSGVVFAAQDRELRRRVAVKVLHRAGSDSCGRILREAKICEQLCNEHIVSVLDVGYLSDGVPFLVMEHLEGEDLSALVARGPLELATAIDYFLQICSAVSRAHEAGIVHRDLKPANVFVARTGDVATIKVLDFGLSKPLHGLASILTALTVPATISGMVIGTPAYMAPEQLLGDRNLDARTDIWGLGVVLFELLTGARPFIGDSFPALAIAIATCRPRNPMLLRPELPEHLASTVLRCLAKSPTDRFPTVDALVAAVKTPSAAPRQNRVPRTPTEQPLTDPAIRAAAVRDVFAFLDKFEPGTCRRVWEQVPTESRQIIEGAPRSAWISIEHDHWLVDAIVDLFGIERAIECWQDVIPSIANRPFLRNLVSGTIATLGRSPASVVRIYVKAWSIVYRGLCEPKLIATADGQPTIRFERIAPEVQRYTNYLHSWHGACRGFAYLARVHGDVRFEVASDSSWAEAKFFWQDGDGEREVERSGS